MKNRVNLAVDMFGCPNRCRHCWLGRFGHQPMAEGADLWIVDYFRPFFREIVYYSWLREPDFSPDYRARWDRDCAISVGAMPERFQLASFWRLSRDPDYATFLNQVGVRQVQLTFFGPEEMTDRYVGRRGAFQELLRAVDVLLDHGIVPRVQAFINRENRDEVGKLLPLFESLRLPDRCQEVGIPFSFFVHEGSCDGENRRLYDVRITKQEIPAELRPYYLNYDQLLSEKECCERMKDNPLPVVYHNDDDIVLNITSNYDVYFNFTNISKNWRIGNMKQEKPEELVRKIVEEDIFALRLARGISLGELVKRHGDASSEKVFSPGDFKEYLLNNYIEENMR